MCLFDNDQSVRFIAGDTWGRLFSLCAEADVGRHIKGLTDLVIANRDPTARAGCAFALGSMLYYLGGMTAGLHLRNVLGLLISLANDPHPTVHFWALDGLERTITAAGLSFSPHVSSCLGAISNLILSGLFDPDDVGGSFSAVALETPTLAALVRCIDAIINVMGPDLPSSKKSRLLIYLLVGEAERDTDMLVSAEGIRCMEHLNLFSPATIDLGYFIRRSEALLTSQVSQMKQLACEIIYGLMRKDAETLFRSATSSLPDELWGLLNLQGKTSDDAQAIIRCWVDWTALSEGHRWIEMCLEILTHSEKIDNPPNEEPGGDRAVAELSEPVDEAAAFSSQNLARTLGPENQSLYLRWQGISFAMSCLRQVVGLYLSEGPLKSQCSTHLLVLRVGDLIKAAFAGCTSTVVGVRLEGLKLLHDLIKVCSFQEGSNRQGLACCVDPDFPDSTLLEQYQAHIASALTPAFAADSSPEIAAEAISICAEFISSNIVKDVDQMGRLLKILIAGLVNIEGERFRPSSNSNW